MFVARFSDPVFAVCAIASTEFYEEDVRLRDYCDKLFDKLTSRQAKFFLAMYRCSGDIPADEEDLEDQIYGGGNRPQLRPYS